MEKTKNLIIFTDLDGSLLHRETFQFESIKSNFGNTSSANTSSYFLGKIAYENSDFINSSLHLNDFLKYSDDDILVCGAIKLLTEFPDQKSKLLNNLDLLPNFAQETIRMVSPVIHMRRTTLCETTIGSQKLGPGEKIVM